MKPLARVGDSTTGICSCGHKNPHQTSGTIISGAGNVTSDGRGNARIGDLVQSSDGRTGIIVSGSGVVFIEGSGAAHVGDLFVGCYTGTITSGSPVAEGS